MNSQKNIINCLNTTLKDYKETVTELSKTNQNYFIKNSTIMFDWDKLSKLNEGDDSSSVDAIYCHMENNELRLYLFEFKQLDIREKFFDARKQLNEIIGNMEGCVFCCGYLNELKKTRKKLVSKKVISLKTKPLESLILLHNHLNKHNIRSEDIIKIKKEYYIVSLTQLPQNKSNAHRKIRTKGVFDFLDKICPFPFIRAEPLNEESFIELITDLEEKQEIISFKSFEF